jgi:phage major head subunit gpT-like protein
MLPNVASIAEFIYKKKNTLQFQTFHEQFDANIFVEDNFSCLVNSIQNKTLGFKKIKYTNDHPQKFFTRIIFYHKLYNIKRNKNIYSNLFFKNKN